MEKKKSSYFAHDRLSLDGFSKMYKQNWKKKLENAEKLIEYGLIRGAKIDVPSIAVK